jgi:hypothetical protein
MTEGPLRHESAEAAADAVIEAVGKTIVLGLPLGLGKPAQFANALYRRAVEDPSISLTVFTALTLEVPEPSSDIEARLVEPIYERLYGGYEALDYATARRKGTLPSNVEIHEFFLQPGALKDLVSAQADYVSSNYTLAPRDILDREHHAPITLGRDQRQQHQKVRRLGGPPPPPGQADGQSDPQRCRDQHGEDGQLHALEQRRTHRWIVQDRQVGITDVPAEREPLPCAPRPSRIEGEDHGDDHRDE